MQKVSRASLVACMLFMLHPWAANGLSSFGKKPLDNEDISQILNQKLLQYDQPRRTIKGSNSNFSLNYNKNYGKVSRLGGVGNPMMEQQSRLNDFKSFNQGPRGSEGFYGFSMKIPLQPK